MLFASHSPYVIKMTQNFCLFFFCSRCYTPNKRGIWKCLRHVKFWYIHVSHDITIIGCLALPLYINVYIKKGTNIPRLFNK